ncbi:S9 family peptidase [Limimaricola pyoseonensis]|uniref:Oligopeptidase B Serine peptidase. MEROPS family S09A n=1 Tax=Limimaricola pyoseonensis TaxID=521013 RepID=A0A1G7AK25_9RHOB|nr:S9 family peptidase [Limimaricola pyoseonensis]SDE14226.1 oligopeptidase B Serine peptidase. MEROPS family S09A [Limimaricola pyoseonensis]
MPNPFKALPDAPVAERRPTSTRVHGVALHDDYAWLRAENWQEAMRDPRQLPADIAAYLTAENDYYEAAMADTAALQERLVREMRGRIKEDDSSVPRRNGPFAYAVRFADGAEYPRVVRTPREGGDEHVLLDVDVEAEAQDYFQLGRTQISPDHRTLAWSADVNGSEFFRLRFRDIASGADLDEEIPDVASMAWADARTLFYVRVDARHHPNKVYQHVLGSDPAEDVLVFTESDTRYGVGVERLRSGAYVAISTGMNDENEVHLIPTADPEAVPHVVEPRSTGLEYEVEHQGDRLLILTNADDAVDFKVVSAPVAQPSRDNWSDLIPHEPGRMIVGLAAFEGWTVWTERRNALPRICYVAAGRPPEEAQVIGFEEQAYALAADPGPEYATDVFRFTYSSPTTPPQVFDYDLSSGERVLRKTQEIPSGHDPADYVTLRITAPSHDGAEVPVTILHHKDTPLDGSAPCLLYGYGSYGASMPAAFSANRLSLVNRGFVHAIAHVRGGEELGRGWYEAAKFGGKPNTFHDFIAAAETLIGGGYSAAGRIVIQGGSAGGLLVGAVLNMRPDLWAGAIADVPFVDVLATILDDSLPLTPGEWSQWGNPIESREAFEDIRGYSPYDNVAAQDYPPMLVTAGVSDPRVTYWEPAKWVARLRASKTDDNILMLRTNMTSGHFGKSGRFAALEDAARSYAFALKVTGADPATA